MGSGCLQYLDTLTQVAEGDPGKVCPRIAGRLFELRKRLLLHGDDGDVVTEAARPLEHEEGKPAVAGNQTNAGHWKSKSLSLGLGEEMLRRIACGTLLSAMLVLAGACGSSTTTPTPPATTTITETFAGTLNPAGTILHPVFTLTGGPVVATLTVVGPDATKTVGFSLGTFNPTLNICTVVFDNPAALQAAAFNTIASTSGFYCVRMYDNGTVATAATEGTATSFSYTVTVTHP